MRLDCSGMEFEKLADLLEQGQFELLNLPVGDERKKPSDIRLVYMMNDTAESFLVFHEAVLTGNYLPDYEGELSASLDKEETDNTDAEGEEKGRYILAVHQGDTVCTLFFKDISLECELYDYGEIGHFWVKGYEYLRQLEYKIAILGDKWEYLGEDCCSEEEKKLAVFKRISAVKLSVLSGSFTGLCKRKRRTVEMFAAGSKTGGRGCKTGERYLVCKNGIPV